MIQRREDVVHSRRSSDPPAAPQERGAEERTGRKSKTGAAPGDARPHRASRSPGEGWKGPPPGARSREGRPPGPGRRSLRERWCGARRAGVRPRRGRAPASPRRARPVAAGRPPGCTPSPPGTSGRRTRAAPGHGRAARPPSARGGRWAPPGSGPAGGARAARAWPGRAREGTAASSYPCRGRSRRPPRQGGLAPALISQLQEIPRRPARPAGDGEPRRSRAGGDPPGTSRAPG